MYVVSFGLIGFQRTEMSLFLGNAVEPMDGHMMPRRGRHIYLFLWRSMDFTGNFS